MSAIFLSHSSQDNEAAAKLRDQLEQAGHHSVFLDFDPAHGIPAGRDWEKELYRRLRSSQAVIVLCSEQSMASRWCFVEIAHAKSFGKHIFPVKVGDCSIDEILTSNQILDLNADEDDALKRLWRGLKIAGLDPANAFLWDGKRPPYPGLLAFQETDAAIFFGREPEIQQGLDSLHRMRRFGGACALMAFGASGSGKSSLVRAGLVPRLRRNSDEWLVVDSFRPQGRPMRELTSAMTQTAARYADDGEDWQRLDAALRKAAEANDEASDEASDDDDGLLHKLASDLRRAAGHPEATVLLVIDQAEELLQSAESAENKLFLKLLRLALDATDGAVMAIFTARSDLLGELTKLTELRGLETEDLRIGPMSTDRLVQVIEGPARLAGLDLEPGLSQAMVDDTETDDALPLLAFTLRELYERCRDQGELTVEAYREKLGGLEGSVARAAEAVSTSRKLSDEQQKELRDFFLSLVKVNDQGRYARQPGAWATVPESLHEMVERFVAARLLIFRREDGKRVVEVAHEALFRSWDRLRSWLDEDREFLLWRKRLDQARREWERLERDPRALLQGPALEESRGWLKRHGERLGEDEHDYFQTSLRADDKRRRQRKWLLSAAFVFLAIIAAAGMALWQRAEKLRAAARDLGLIALADDWIDEDPTRAALALLHVRNPEATPRTAATMGEALQQALTDVVLRGHEGRLGFAAWSRDGRRLVTASEDGTARVWTADGAVEIVLQGHDDAITAAALSPNGEHLATASEDGTARIWRVDVAAEVVLRGHQGPLTSVAWSPDGRQVITASEDGTARVFALDGGAVAVLEGHEKRVTAVAVGPDGRRLATASEDKTARLWNRDGTLDKVLRGHQLALTSVAWGADGQHLVTASKDRTARVWQANGTFVRALTGHDDEITALAAHPDNGNIVVTASEDATARIWTLDNKAEPVVLSGHDDAITAVAYDPLGRRLVTTSEDRTARVWRVDDDSEPVVLHGHADTVRHAAWSHDGHLVTASSDGTARIWSDQEPMETVLIDDGDNQIVAAAFGPGATSLVAALEDQSLWFWRVDHVEDWKDDALDGRAVPLGRHDDTVTAVAIDPKGKLVASGSRDGSAWIRILASPDSTIDLSGHTGAVTAVAFSPGGDLVVTGSEDGIARVWNSDGTVHAVLEGHEGGVTAVAFSPDGERVVTGSEDESVRVWTLQGQGVVLPAGHGSLVWNVAYGNVANDQNGTYVTSCAADRTSRVWRLDDTVAEPAAPIVFREHDVDCRAITFAADGHRMATVRGKGNLWVRRIDAGRAPKSIVLQSDSEILAVAFTDDGDRLLTISENGTVRGWLLSIARLSDQIRASTRACLAPEYRERALGETTDEAQFGFATCKQGR